MKTNKASGIDKVTKEKYSENPGENLENLIDRLKEEKYRPKPSRRVYIPKDGSNRMRPLGISSYEDKLVENAIAEILIPIYETKFIKRFQLSLQQTCTGKQIWKNRRNISVRKL